MELSEIRKFLHDLNNYLNAAKINAYLLRRMHEEVLDKETLDGLDSALLDAEKLTSEFHQHVHELQSDVRENSVTAVGARK